MKDNIHNNRIHRPKEIYKLISFVTDIKKRNFLRGCCTKSRLTSRDIELIRRGNSPNDSLIIGAVLNAPGGLLNKSSIKKKSSEIFKFLTFPAIEWRSEICYTAGYINSASSLSIEILDHINSLAFLESMDTDNALEILLGISKKFGASNYLSFKLAYLRNSRELTASALAVVSQIEDEIGHRESVGLHFSALEHLSLKISLFLVAQRRVSGLVAKVQGDFRKSLSLHNFTPTPLDPQDVAAFLLRATESCLFDTIYSVLILFNLSKDFGPAVSLFEQYLDARLITKFTDTVKFLSGYEGASIVTDHYRFYNEGDYSSLDLYRISAAFLERPKFAIYRNQFDRVIGARLLEEVIDGKINLVAPMLNDKSCILAPDSTLVDDICSLQLDIFYRTFLFLRFIGNKNNILTLTKEEIKYIFEHTLHLESLLTEDEIRALYITAPAESKSLIAVLALALFRQKTIDPDVDFEYRNDFISHVNDYHDGSILKFINYLLADSPQVATYIVDSLDESTLQKLYTLVKNASQASNIRVEILRAVGQRQNQIEYFIEADAISTRHKLSELMQYFDSSRMYVDSISMKKWLDSNPSVSMEQYRSLYPKIEARMSSIESYSGRDKNILIIQFNNQNEYLISQIAKDAFEQFCLNTEFGIESYLGRRIRHNTIDGVTIDTVDAVFNKQEYQVLMANPNMRKTVDSWMATYKSIIDKLRREHLQFKSQGLFNSALDFKDAFTKDNIRKFSSTLEAAGGCELINDLAIAFCWNQITPQLENAARFIKTKLLSETNASIDKYFSIAQGQLVDQMISDLHEAANEVFRKVSDWFQVPQTGFISASVRDLCQIIFIDLKRDGLFDFAGDAADIKYTGISVHRLYDCLAVVLQNAHIHGEYNVPILVNVNTSRKYSESILDVVSVEITSIVSDEKYEESKYRILNAIETEATGIDMVTEGYTGIKKVKFITKASEGAHTVRCAADDNKRALSLSFTLHMEMAVDDLQEGI